jgi:DNA-binding MarR family transcriptional regulator
MEDYQNLSMYQACLLHSRADRALRVMVSHKLEEYKLSMMEWLLLATVCEGPINGLTMTDVASKLTVTLPQVTALMNDLVRQKLIKQKVSTSDRRSRRLLCTLQGKRIVTKIEQSLKTAMDKWLADVPKERLEIYMQTVAQLANQNNKT